MKTPPDIVENQQCQVLWQLRMKTGWAVNPTVLTIVRLDVHGTDHFLIRTLELPTYWIPHLALMI